MPDTNSLGGANELILPVRDERMKKWACSMMWNPATNQISLLNSCPNPVHRKYERFACTIRIGLKYLSTSTNLVRCNFLQTAVDMVEGKKLTTQTIWIPFWKDKLPIKHSRIQPIVVNSGDYSRSLKEIKDSSFPLLQSYTFSFSTLLCYRRDTELACCFM